MRLVTYKTDDSADLVRWGVIKGDRVLDVARAMKEHTSRAETLGIQAVDGIKTLLELHGGIDRLHQFIDAVSVELNIFDKETVSRPLSKVQLLPPVPWPGKFLCVGKNNKNHLDELLANDLLKEMPKEPTGFIKLQQTLIGDHAAVARPNGVVAFDYEPELAFVIGKPGINISAKHAIEHVAGVMLFNDLTDRETQKREVASGTRFWTAKNMPGFAPVGPCLITMDEIDDPNDLWISLRVNGERRIRFNTANYIFQIPQVIEHFSRHLPLEPGDQFALGSPGGVAVGQPNADELYLKPGDTVECILEGFATLTTYIV